MTRGVRSKRTRGRLGQHFLRDPFVLRRIASFLRPEKGDLVVEIGAGRGALTRILARAVSPAGRLIALELDPDLAADLRRKFAGVPGVSILEADARTFDFSAVARTGGRTVRVVGNLPYYAATTILLNLLKWRGRIQDVVVMVQKEVADRIAANPGSKDYGRLSVAMQLWCEVDLGFDVDPKAFRPPPKVFSTVLRLIPQTRPRVPLSDPHFFEQIVRASFAQRRKTLLNNLKAHFGREEVARIQQALAECEIDPARRAETLRLEEFARLSDRLAKKGENQKI
ncbi:MAG: 16S rRNA (adenine(1518)-N(6)/adenine(1519)-N(6))-dimethyltransferase RsmA [Nitrospinota bacterium]